MVIFRTGDYEPITTTHPSFTNADRIRAMTDEELAFYIVNHPMWTDESACVNWLKEEAKE